MGEWGEMVGEWLVVCGGGERVVYAANRRLQGISVHPSKEFPPLRYSLENAPPFL